MTPVELVRQARALGVTLGVESGRLHYQAPAGALIGALRDALVANKRGVLRVLAAEAAGWSGSDASDYLKTRAAIRESDGGFSPAAARRLAWNDLDRALGILGGDDHSLDRDQIADLFDAVPVQGLIRALSSAEEAAAITTYAQRSGTSLTFERAA